MNDKPYDENTICTSLGDIARRMSDAAERGVRQIMDFITSENLISDADARVLEDLNRAYVRFTRGSLAAGFETGAHLSTEMVAVASDIFSNLAVPTAAMARDMTYALMANTSGTGVTPAEIARDRVNLHIMTYERTLTHMMDKLAIQAVHSAFIIQDRVAAAIKSRIAVQGLAGSGRMESATEDLNVNLQSNRQDRDAEVPVADAGHGGANGDGSPADRPV